MINSEPRRLWGFTYTLDPEHDQKQASLMWRLIQASRYV